LARMIRRHQADEERHAEMFRACLARTGVDPGPVPEEVKMLVLLDRALDGICARPIVDRAQVMEAYVLLQVIEERAVTQFALIEPTFRRLDPQTADVLVAIGKDEERHLRYCHAIGRRYAPSPEAHRATLERFRAVEARTFAVGSLANMAQVRARRLTR